MLLILYYNSIVRLRKKGDTMKKQMMVVNLMNENGIVLDRQTFKNLRDVEMWLNEAYANWQEKGYNFEIFYK